MRTLGKMAIVMTLAASLGSLAALPGEASVGAVGAVTVKIGDNYYKPTKVTVTAGQKVTWKWVGSAIHDVVVKKGPKKFKSKKQVEGTYSKVLTNPGKYQIYCTVHPNMTMTLTVKAAPPATTLPPAT